MRKTEEEQGAKLVRGTLGIVIGGVAALLVCLAVLFIASLGIAGGVIGDGLMYQVAVLGCVLGAFTGGTIAVHRCGERSLLVGLAVGAALFLLLLTVNVVVFDAAPPESGRIGLLCGCLCGGAVSGLLGGRKRKNTGRTKKKRRK